MSKVKTRSWIGDILKAANTEDPSLKEGLNEMADVAKDAVIEDSSSVRDLLDKFDEENKHRYKGLNVLSVVHAAHSSALTRIKGEIESIANLKETRIAEAKDKLEKLEAFYQREKSQIEDQMKLDDEVADVAIGERESTIKTLEKSIKALNYIDDKEEENESERSDDSSDE